MFIDSITNHMNAISVGRKHEEIMMRWVNAQEEGKQTEEFWEVLQKEYNEFEKGIYPILKK